MSARARSRSAGPGEPCLGPDRLRCLDGYCDADGLCVGWAGAHQPCAQGCAEPLACFDGHCERHGRSESREECPSDLTCVEGRCRAPRAVGEPCTSEEDCASTARCVDGACARPARCTTSGCALEDDCVSNTAEGEARRCVAREGERTTPGRARTTAGLPCDEAPVTFCEPTFEHGRRVPLLSGQLDEGYWACGRD